MGYICSPFRRLHTVDSCGRDSSRFITLLAGCHSSTWEPLLTERQEQALVIGFGVWDGGVSSEQWVSSLLSVPFMPSGPFLVCPLGKKGASWAVREECN